VTYDGKSAIIILDGGVQHKSRREKAGGSLLEEDGPEQLSHFCQAQRACANHRARFSLVARAKYRALQVDLSSESYWRYDFYLCRDIRLSSKQS